MVRGKIFHIFVDLRINESFEISRVVLWFSTKLVIVEELVTFGCHLIVGPTLILDS